MRTPVKHLVLVFLFLPGISQNVAAAIEDVEVTEILVSGKLQGPPMWEVKNGNHKLVIFGLPRVTPELLQWNSLKVEQVLEETQAALQLLEVRLDVGKNPFKLLPSMNAIRKSQKLEKGETLGEILDPILFLRITALQNKYGPKGDSLHKLQPRIAAKKLQEAALKDSGLSDSARIRNKINKLIKRHDLILIQNEVRATVPIDELKQISTELSEGNDIACLEETVMSLETDLNETHERAFSWSYGEMAEIYLQDYPDPYSACWSDLTSTGYLGIYFNEARELWLQNAKMALDDYSLTFAMLNMYELLSQNGLLAQLEDQGFEIKRP